MNVAVPLPKHSPMFGHEASSHTVCRRCSRRISLISKKRGDEGARTRIHSGLRSGSAATPPCVLGMRRGLARALVLDAGRVGRRLVGGVVHGRVRARRRARIGASIAPAASTSRSHAEVGQLRDREPGKAARIDVPEGCQVHRDVQRQSVIGAAIAHFEAKRGDFRLDTAATHVDTWRVGPAVRRYPLRIKEFYHRRLDRTDHVPDAQAGAAEVDEQVGDHLPRPVIGDLPAAIDLDHGNAGVAPQMLAAPGEPERVHRRMLGQPDLVGGTRVARVGERLHRAPAALVIGMAERPDDGAAGLVAARGCPRRERLRDGVRLVHGSKPAVRRQSTIATIGWDGELAIERVQLLARRGVDRGRHREVVALARRAHLERGRREVRRVLQHHVDDRLRKAVVAPAHHLDREGHRELERGCGGFAHGDQPAGEPYMYSRVSGWGSRPSSSGLPASSCHSDSQPRSKACADPAMYTRQTR